MFQNFAKCFRSEIIVGITTEYLVPIYFSKISYNLYFVISKMGQNRGPKIVDAKNRVYSIAKNSHSEICSLMTLTLSWRRNNQLSNQSATSIQVVNK